MSYETVAMLSQVTSLLMFIAMFAAVLVYALWPSNGRKFEEIQESSLDLEPIEVRRAARDMRGSK